MGEAKKKAKFSPAEDTIGVSITLGLSEVRVSEVLSKGDVENALSLILQRGIDPIDIEAKRLQVMMFMRAKKMDEAKKLLDELVYEVPDGLTFKMMGDWAFLTNEFQKSENWYGRALSKIPDHPDIVHDYGVALVSQGKMELGIGEFKRACELAPTRADFWHHLSIMLVLNGKEKEGWAMMEKRLEIPGICGMYPRPEAYWKGEDLSGKTLVLRTEQGFGDTIMFMRYARLIQQQHKPKKMYAFCQPAMVSFVEHFYPYVEGWPNTAPPPMDFDYHINIMSLPNIFPGQHLREPAVMPRGDGIGMCWFGSPTHKADHLRTVGFERFMDMMDSKPNERYLCAAYGFFDQKPDNVDYFITRCRDWKETALVMREELKLMITVDTAIGHLSSFLGIPTWFLLPRVPDFRWGFGGDSSCKWYESARLYRQSKLFDWDGVFARVKKDLQAV